MRFFSMQKRRPANGQWCVIREKRADGTTYIAGYKRQYFDDDRDFETVVDWAPFPRHVEHDPTGWKSIYRGDDLPTGNCDCLVCCEDVGRNYKAVHFAYFLDREQRFLARPDVLAFMVI